MDGMRTKYTSRLIDDMSWSMLSVMPGAAQFLMKKARKLNNDKNESLF